MKCMPHNGTMRTHTSYAHLYAKHFTCVYLDLVRKIVNKILCEYNVDDEDTLIEMGRTISWMV